MKYKAGDIVIHSEDGEHQLAKILRTEEFESAEESWTMYHVLLFAATVELPSPDDVANMIPEILHLPVASEDIDENVVESHVSKLRKRLRHRLGFDPIDSQRYLGYRLIYT